MDLRPYIEQLRNEFAVAAEGPTLRAGRWPSGSSRNWKRRPG
ncbi:hypothetical protein ACFQ1L_29045 [Phytohabitans flavus]